MRNKIMALLLLAALFCAPLFAAEGEHEASIDAAYWWDQFVKLFNFGIVAAVLYLVLRKPVRNFFSSRARQIDESLRAAEKARLEAERKLADLKLKIAGLELEMAAIRDKARKDGEAEEERIIQAARAEAEKILESARREIENSIKAGRAELRAFAAEQAVAQARELLRRGIDAEDERRLLDRFINTVGGVQ